MHTEFHGEGKKRFARGALARLGTRSVNKNFLRLHSANSVSGVALLRAGEQYAVHAAPARFQAHCIAAAPLAATFRAFDLSDFCERDPIVKFRNEGLLGFDPSGRVGTAAVAEPWDIADDSSAAKIGPLSYVSPARHTHMSRHGRPIMPAIDDEIVSLGLAADRLADRIIQLGIARAIAQHGAGIRRIVLPQAHVQRPGAGQPHTIAKLSQKL